MSTQIFGFLTPMPAFASVAITTAEVSDVLKVVTLLIGCAISCMMLMSWYYRARKELATERLAEITLMEARLAAHRKLNEAEEAATQKLHVAEGAADQKLHVAEGVAADKVDAAKGTAAEVVIAAEVKAAKVDVAALEALSSVAPNAVCMASGCQLRKGSAECAASDCQLKSE